MVVLLMLIASYTRGVLVQLRRHNDRFKRVTMALCYESKNIEKRLQEQPEMQSGCVPDPERDSKVARSLRMKAEMMNTL